VTVVTGLKQILAECERQLGGRVQRPCVVQKYLERPLLVPRSDGGAAKADLRLWVLVLDWKPLTAFINPGAYFRVATRAYALDAGEHDPLAHKTNCRDWDNRTPLATLLRDLGPEAAEAWRRRTWPQICDAVRAVLFAVRGELLLGSDGSTTRRRPSQTADRPSGPRAFELFGIDFAVDESWRPWLLEVNTSPNMLEDCDGEYAAELRGWAQSATESLLHIAVAHHTQTLQLPELDDLDRRAPAVGTDEVERLFPAGSLLQGHSGAECCYGVSVASTPLCLVAGLELGAPYGAWRLVVRERLDGDRHAGEPHIGEFRSRELRSKERRATVPSGSSVLESGRMASVGNNSMSAEGWDGGATRLFVDLLLAQQAKGSSCARLP